MLKGVKLLFGGWLACALAIPAWTQSSQAPTPRFEDFPAKTVFSGISAKLQLTTPQERRFRTVIRNGVTKGWGVADGISGKERPRPGPNFAQHYVIVTWGCGSPCIMTAIVDLNTGRVYPPPFHRPGNSYFQLPWTFPLDPPMSFRLDSRLLVANVCEEEKIERGRGQTRYTGDKCGAHYFVMSENGLKLVHRVLEQ